MCMLQDGSTALMMASEIGHIAVVEQLLKHNALADLQEQVSWTPAIALFVVCNCQLLINGIYVVDGVDGVDDGRVGRSWSRCETVALPQCERRLAKSCKYTAYIHSIDAI